jgi:streptogramin lyase
MRFGIPAALLAMIALALPAFASADPLGSLSLYKSGLRSTAYIFTDTAGPDGNVWFVDSKLFSGGIPAIGRVKPSGEIKEYVSGTNLSGLKAGSDPVAIATGPDEKLWFTDKGTTPAIGVIDPASPEAAEEFSILEKGGNEGSVPQGIVAFEGKLWFTDRGTTPAIGSIDPSTHVVEEFPIKAEGGFEGSAPAGIVASGGKLWFTDGGTTRAIGVFDPSAPATERVKEFATGANSEPGGTSSNVGGWGIAAGPDGNVWFTEGGSNATEGRSATGKAIGRIEPSGTITYFSEGLIESSKPLGLTAAPGGKLWFADRSGLNEKQLVTIEDSGTLGGTYKLGFGGKETGWTGEGTREAQVSGTGNVLRVTGAKGEWAANSKTIKITTKPASNFTVGELFQNSSPFTVAYGATIVSCSPGCGKEEVTELTVSKESSGEAKTNQTLVAGGVEVTSGGPFEVGKEIAGTGITAGSTIKVITGSVLALSTNPNPAGTGVALTTGGSKTLAGVTTTTGKLSNGEEISGTGIAAGTTISSFNEEAGTITLSKFPTSSGTSSLSADLPFGAESFVVQDALQKLSSIGAENAEVEFETGTTSPVKRIVDFVGAMGATDVEQLTCNGAGLTGTSPSCSVETTVQGVPNAVGSITTSGTITRYPESGLNFGPTGGITAGPGGNLWLPTGTLSNTQFAKFGINEGPTNRRTLTITKSAGGSGGVGTVSSKPSGIKCSTACNKDVASFYKESSVTLTAKPSSTSTFVEWTGACSGASPTCTVAMSEDKAVGAVFGGTSKAIASPTALTVSKGESTENFGHGSVKASGLYCEADCNETTVLYQGTITEPKPKPAKTVELSQTPYYGSEFTGWSGCDSEAEGKCIVTMSAAKEVTAEYTAKPNVALTITKNTAEGSYEGGTGTVTSKPKGLKCATTCTAQTMAVPSGEAIVLKAKAATGMTFTGWSGGGCSGTAETCTVSPTEATKVTASFSGAPKAIANAQKLTLAKAGSGYGTVKASGIACEAACTSATSLYTGGVELPKPKPAATVTLEAISAPGSKAVVWSGCDSETEGKCVVATSAAKEVTATFDELE